MTRRVSITIAAQYNKGFTLSSLPMYATLDRNLLTIRKLRDLGLRVLEAGGDLRKQKLTKAKSHNYQV